MVFLAEPPYLILFACRIVCPVLFNPVMQAYTVYARMCYLPTWHGLRFSEAHAFSDEDLISSESDSSINA